MTRAVLEVITIEENVLVAYESADKGFSFTLVILHVVAKALGPLTWLHLL